MSQQPSSGSAGADSTGLQHISISNVTNINIYGFRGLLSGGQSRWHIQPAPPDQGAPFDDRSGQHNDEAAGNSDGEPSFARDRQQLAETRLQVPLELVQSRRGEHSRPTSRNDRPLDATTSAVRNVFEPPPLPTNGPSGSEALLSVPRRRQLVFGAADNPFGPHESNQNQARSSPLPSARSSGQVLHQSHPTRPVYVFGKSDEFKSNVKNNFPFTFAWSTRSSSPGTIPQLNPPLIPVVFITKENASAPQQPRPTLEPPFASPSSSKSGDPFAFTPSQSGEGTPLPTPSSSLTGILTPPSSTTASLAGGSNRHSSGQTTARAPGSTRGPSREQLARGWDEQRSTEPIRQALVKLAAALSPRGRASDPVSEDFERDVLRLQTLKWQKPWRVGLVGDSDNGKSSLVNSLLDVEGLAWTGSSGNACTVVVTEYHHSRGTPQAINIVQFSEHEIRTQLKELVKAYRFYHQSRTKANDDGGSLEFEDARIKAEVATLTLGAMLNLTSFEFLRNGREEEVLEYLCAKVVKARAAISELISPSNPFVDDVQALKQKLRILVSRSDSDQRRGALWPWIRKVEVYMDSEILRNGLVLVDLPGLRDLNSARCWITKRYLMTECDQIFAVCGIKTVVTNPAVEEVFRLGKLANPASIGIICTKSDDINPPEVLRQAQLDGKMDLVEKLRLWQRKINHLGCKAEMHGGNGEYILEKITRKKQEKAIFERKSYLITKRNESMIKRLHGSRGPSVHVFCVSNKEYWIGRNQKLKDGYKLSLADAQSRVQLSGVPSLVKHCLLASTRAQLHAARASLSGPIHALLASVGIWLRNQEAQGVDGDEILRTLDELQAKLELGLGPETLPLEKLQRRSTTELFVKQKYEKRKCEDWEED